MTRVIVEDHDALGPDDAFDVHEELLHVDGVGLVDEYVLERGPLVGDTTDDGDGFAPVLVEADVDERILGHPEGLHLLPEMRGRFIHVDDLPVLPHVAQQFVQEFYLLVHELEPAPELSVELVGRLPPDDVVLSVDLQEQGLGYVHHASRIPFDLLASLQHGHVAVSLQCWRHDNALGHVSWHLDVPGLDLLPRD